MDLPVCYTSLSPTERRRVREEYIRRQGGLCDYCKAPLSGPPAKEVGELQITTRLYPYGFFKYPIHLHHNHDTGMTLGAIHCYCNAVSWEYEGV